MRLHNGFRNDLQGIRIDELFEVIFRGWIIDLETAGHISLTSALIAWAAETQWIVPFTLMPDVSLPLLAFGNIGAMNLM